MADRLERDIGQRFRIVDTIPIPDNWPRIAAQSQPTGSRSAKRWLLPITVAACVAAVVAALAAVASIRSDDNEIASTVIGLSTCFDEGRCVPAQWDAIAIGGSVIDFVYYVDAECSRTLLGTQFSEDDESVDISVIVETDPTTECSGDVLQRSGSVLLGAPVDDPDGPNPTRALTGCRNAQSPIPSPTDAGEKGGPADCRVEITTRFPVYPSEQLLTEYDKFLADTDIEGVTSEPIDIDEPGIYDLRAYVDADWDINECGYGYSMVIDDFVNVANIEPVDEIENDKQFDVKSDAQGRPYVSWTMQALSTSPTPSKASSCSSISASEPRTQPPVRNALASACVYRLPLPARDLLGLTTSTRAALHRRRMLLHNECDGYGCDRPGSTRAGTLLPNESDHPIAICQRGAGRWNMRKSFGFRLAVQLVA